jgi:uncharacterized protein
MDFEWDEDKRQANVAKHGIDFLRARRVFDGRARLDVASPRGSEDRIATTARLDGRFVTVVWVWRGEHRVRIISARRARGAEEGAYRQLHG